MLGVCCGGCCCCCCPPDRNGFGGKSSSAVESIMVVNNKRGKRIGDAVHLSYHCVHLQYRYGGSRAMAGG